MSPPIIKAEKRMSFKHKTFLKENNWQKSRRKSMMHPCWQLPYIYRRSDVAK